MWRLTRGGRGCCTHRSPCRHGRAAPRSWPQWCTRLGAAHLPAACQLADVRPPTPRVHTPSLRPRPLSSRAWLKATQLIGRRVWWPSSATCRPRTPPVASGAGRCVSRVEWGGVRAATLPGRQNHRNIFVFLLPLWGGTKNDIDSQLTPLVMDI